MKEYLSTADVIPYTHRHYVHTAEAAWRGTR